MTTWRSLASILVGAAACSAPGADDPDDTDTVVDSTPEPCVVPAYDDQADIDCNGDVAKLQGVYSRDVELDPALSWVLIGGVFIGDGTQGNASLTIPAGTTIYGDGATDGFLVIQPGSRILAEGTATDPIVFTSGQPEGSRGRSDWGGLVINGRAPSNACSDLDTCELLGEGGTGFYGGPDADDDSGILEYVRIEFAGTLINERQEINGLALQGVGRGTVIDQLHVHLTADDGIEMFGGTVDLRHIISTGAGDDGFDWTDGWTGRAQYVVVQHHADAGDNGIEADTNKDDFELTPWSEPTIRNMTVVKSRGDRAFTDGYGILLRAGTAGHLHQMAVANYQFGCLNVNDPATFDHGFECSTDAPTATTELTHSWFSCPDTAIEGEPFPADDFDFNSAQETCDVEAWLLMGNAGNAHGDDHGMVRPFDVVDPDWSPAAGSPLLGATVPADADDWFDTNDYIGAIGAEDWTAWTEFAPN